METQLVRRELLLPKLNPLAQVSRPDRQTSATIDGSCSDEIALYDRQIRLWGVKAQERLVTYCPLLRFMSLQADVWYFRLRTANILLITLKALANEVAKNLVLAGIGSLTISDDQFVTEDDVCSQFFVSEEHVGMNVRYQVLLSILHN